MHLTRDADIKRRAKDIPVQYMLFDVLYLEGRSVMARPYSERRELLESLALEGPNWQTPSYSRGNGKALVEASAENGLEGVVAKKLDSTYSPGRRNPHWIKVKNKRRVRLVVAGWLPEKERADRLGALLVGYYDSAGHLRYAGRVGTGFDAKERTRLERLLAPLARSGSPFEGKRGPRGARYVEPRLVAEVEFTEWTNDGMLRHPSYKGLVDDEPESIVLDPAGAGEPDRGRGGGDGQRRDERDARQRAPGRQEGGGGDRRGADPAAHQPRQGHVSEDRVHQARPDRLLRAHRAGAAAAPARTPADVEALSRRRRGTVLLREEVPVAPAGLGAHRGGLEPAQQGRHQLLRGQ